MLDGLRQFIADVVSPHAREDRDFDDKGYRLAATALLIHVISLDGEPTAAEKHKLHSLIESSFGLDRGTADRLIASAMLCNGEGLDMPAGCARLAKLSGLIGGAGTRPRSVSNLSMLTRAGVTVRSRSSAIPSFRVVFIS